MNDVVFQKQAGGLGRYPNGEDYISGMMFFTGSLPSGFTTTYNKKLILSVSDAEDLGIVNDYSDETRSTATWLITTAGSTGNTINFTITEKAIDPKDGATITKTVDLGTYTKASGDSTIALLGASLAAFINAGTYSHGYSASFATATLTITARWGVGKSLNSDSPLAITVVGTTDGTLTNFSGGTYSQLAIWHYHISEYFRINPTGKLWVGFYPVPGTYNFTELQDLQVYASGKIRQAFIYHLAIKTAPQISTDCTAIQAVCDTLEGLHMPVSSVVYAPGFSQSASISTFENLALLEASNVSVCIGQDGGGQGAYLRVVSGISISNGGACLGTVSAAAVNECIGWVGKFNMSNGVENNILAFINGSLYTSYSASTINQVNSYRYIFTVKHIGLSGSYWNDSHTAIIESSDYAYIENNRTIDKAIRIGRVALLPSLNSPLKLNSNGTLANFAIANLTGILNSAENVMIRDNEISAFSSTIDPKQDVLSTSTIYITLKIVPTGTARNIIVKIGFATSI